MYFSYKGFLFKELSFELLFIPSPTKLPRDIVTATVHPSHPCEHSRINILQWILTKLGTYLVLKRIWNPIDFQGQRSRSQGLIFRRGDTPRFALPLLILKFLNFLSKILLLFHTICTGVEQEFKKKCIYVIYKQIQILNKSTLDHKPNIANVGSCSNTHFPDIHVQEFHWSV